jgi:hypothetical protein
MLSPTEELIAEWKPRRRSARDGIVEAIAGSPYPLGLKLWVIFALVRFGLSFLSGILIISPESGRVAKLIGNEAG